MHAQFATTLYLILLISLGYIATDIYLPSLPSLASYFAAADHEVQFTLFTFLVSFSLTPLLLGPLSDRIGRKKVILGGIFLSLLAAIGCLFAQTIYWLSVARFFQGFGLGGVLIATRATVSDLFTGKELAKQMSLTTMLMPFILSIAPMIGGFLQQMFQWQAVFVFLILYTLLILIFASFKSESLKNPNQKKLSQIFTTYRSHLKNRLFVAYSGNFILPSLGLFGYLTVSPFLYQEVIGLSPLEYGSLALYVGATIITTGYLNMKLLPLFAITTLLSIGAALLLVSGGLLLFFQLTDNLNFWTLLLPSLLYFSCIPFCLSNGATKCMSLVQGDFGAANALLTTSQFLFGALAILIFSFLSDETAFSLSVCFILVGAFSLLNLWNASQLEKATENLVKA